MEVIFSLLYIVHWMVVSNVHPPAVFSPNCRRMLGIEWAVLSGQWDSKQQCLNIEQQAVCLVPGSILGHNFSGKKDTSIVQQGQARIKLEQQTIKISSQLWRRWGFLYRRLHVHCPMMTDGRLMDARWMDDKRQPRQLIEVGYPPKNKQSPP